jgi:carbon storage regulator
VLVIRCREGESVSIGDDIQLSVLSIDAGRVKLGFTAPPSIPVSRHCAELTREQNKGAALRIDRSVLGSLSSYLAKAPQGAIECVVSVSPAGAENKARKNAKEFEPAADK